MKISDPASGDVQLVLTGIPIAQLHSSQTIAKFVDELRGEIKDAQERARRF